MKTKTLVVIISLLVMMIASFISEYLLQAKGIVAMYSFWNYFFLGSSAVIMLVIIIRAGLKK